MGRIKKRKVGIREGGTEPIIIYTTVSQRRGVKRIVQYLLKKRYIACANIFLIESNYWWRGKIEKGKEFGLFLKTEEKNYEIIERELKKIHPYELPCILSFRVARGEKHYLKWIEEEVI